jgi:hypothetical protein
MCAMMCISNLCDTAAFFVGTNLHDVATLAVCMVLLLLHCAQEH